MAERMIYVALFPTCWLVSKAVEIIAPSQADLEASPAAIQFGE